MCIYSLNDSSISVTISRLGMAGTPSSRLEEIIKEDCDYEDIGGITYCSCLRRLYTNYESCHEEQETLKLDHGNLLGKKLKKMVKALVWRKRESFCLRRLWTCTNGAKEKKRKMQFHYDQKSYALNFDDGIEEGDSVFLDFSARYACPLLLGIN